MRRRQALKIVSTTGLAAIAGCLGGSPETEGDDDNPIEASPEELLPSADLFGDGWEQHDNEVLGLHPVELEGDTATAAFATGDGQQGIDVQVTIFDLVDEAVSGYQEMRDSDSEGSDDITEDVGIASEGYSIEIGSGTVYFRDANVIGMLSHVTNGASNSSEYAADWHETWRDN